MFRNVCASGILALSLLAGPARLPAQYQTRTWLDWRTIETPRFAFHFPRELEGWTRAVAAHLESIDTTVSRLAGYRPSKRIEVVIDDPFRISNGSAWPLRDNPALVLWATPPNPREDIGTFTSWSAMLATHEYAHLAHLLRPSRNAWQSLIWKAAPVELGPLSRKTPRWMIEGYATYIEGVVTGSGRPNGVWRPTILRQWAIEGALPIYSQLDGTSGMYGGDFAYLAGSAFIEWLIARRGESSLVDLWRRLSARRDRGFVEAFSGVYGEPPDVLYGRFTAELTADAKAFESSVRSRGDSGTVIQHLTRETGDPAISHEGGRVALMLASATRPGRVVIWSTLAERDTLTARSDSILVRRDRGDVPPYRPFPLAKRALATLHPVGNQPYIDPRFFRDGRLLVWRNTAIGDGSYAPDLYVWDPQRGRVTRLTKGANVRQGEPSPDGRSIAALRCEAGHCDLVLVSATGGTIRTLAGGDDMRSYYRPRFAPDGQSVLVSAHDAGAWRLASISVNDGAVRFLTPPGQEFYDGSFADDTTIVATWNTRAGRNAAPTIVRMSTSGAVTPIAAVTGAAVAPETNPADRSVWFLALHARGWDLRSVPLSRTATAVASAQLVPVAVAPRAGGGSPVPPSTRYRAQRKWIYFPGGNFVRDGGNVLLGLVNSDPVGKMELLIQGAKSLEAGWDNPPWEGVSAAFTIRSRPSWTASVFTVTPDHRPGQSLRGGALSAEFTKRTENRSMRLTAGGTLGRSVERDPKDRALLFSELAVTRTRFHGGRRTTGYISGSWSTGRLESERIGTQILTGGVASSEIPVSLSATVGFAAAAERFIVGGHPPTLVQPGVLSRYISMPALPSVLTGDRIEAYRLAVPFAGMQLYTWVGRATDGQPSVPYERVYGLEWTRSIAQIAVLGTPTARVTVGLGRWDTRHAIANPVIGLPFLPRGSPMQFYLTTQFGDWAR